MWTHTLRRHIRRANFIKSPSLIDLAFNISDIILNVSFRFLPECMPFSIPLINSCSTNDTCCLNDVMGINKTFDTNVANYCMFFFKTKLMTIWCNDYWPAVSGVNGEFLPCQINPKITERTLPVAATQE
jgi:hypothetical protein